jgi:hypothetical protein
LPQSERSVEAIENNIPREKTDDLRIGRQKTRGHIDFHRELERPSFLAVRPVF